MSAETALPRPLTLLIRGMGLVAGVLLLIIILLTVGDVVSRNLRDRSIVGVVDMSTMLLVATAYLGLASAEADGRHVSVELVERRLGARARLVFSVLRSAVLVGLGAAGRFKSLQEESVRGQTQVVVTRVRLAYYQLLLSQEQERLTENSLHRVRKSLEETQALHRAGLASEYDVLRLQGELANLAVRPEYRGQGYAARLLDHVLRNARERDVEAI